MRRTIKRLILASALTITSVNSFAGWTTLPSKDTSDGRSGMHSRSTYVRPIKLMNFPYSDVEASISINCAYKKLWVSFNFNETPTLVGATIEDRYSTINSRLKWDEKIENSVLQQVQGSKNLTVLNDSLILDKLLKHERLTLELDWYGNGKTHFNFPLDGVSESVHKITEKCNLFINGASSYRFFFKNKVIEEQLHKEYFQVGFFDRKNISLNGNFVTARLKNHDSSPEDTLSTMLSLVEKAASTIDEKYTLSIKVIGNPKNTKTSEDNFSADDITDLFIKAVKARPQIKAHITNAVVESEDLSYYTKSDSKSLAGRIKNDRAEIEVLVQASNPYDGENINNQSSSVNTELGKYEALDIKSLKDWNEDSITIDYSNRKLKKLGFKGIDSFDVIRKKSECINGFKAMSKDEKKIPGCVEFMNNMYEKTLYYHYDNCINSAGYNLDVEPNISNHIEFCTYLGRFPKGENAILIKSLMKQGVDKIKERKKTIH